MAVLSFIVKIDVLWEDKNHTSRYEDFIEEYRTKYQTIKKQRKLAAEASPVVSLEQYRLSPNSCAISLSEICKPCFASLDSASQNASA